MPQINLPEDDSENSNAPPSTKKNSVDVRVPVPVLGGGKIDLILVIKTTLKI